CRKGGGNRCDWRWPMRSSRSLLLGLLALAADRPFDGGARADRAGEHDLLRFLGLAGAEIDAVGEAHLRALRAQAKADAAGQAEERGGAVLDERDLYRRVEVEADG